MCQVTNISEGNANVAFTIIVGKPEFHVRFQLYTYVVFLNNPFIEIESCIVFSKCLKCSGQEVIVGLTARVG